jgi:hypothetical protein
MITRFVDFLFGIGIREKTQASPCARSAKRVGRGRKQMNEREYWLAVAYYHGRALGSGWEDAGVNVPDKYRADAKDAYDRGVADYIEIDENLPDEG